jgi:hypothetical protein
MHRPYRLRPTVRLASVTLAVLATTSIGVFIDGLVRDRATREAYSPQPVVVAKVLRSFSTR